MGEELDYINSNKIEKKAEAFKKLLLNESEALSMFKKAESIFESSGLDMEKKQYKSETETELLISAYKKLKSD
ncbi:hypothetical protein JCM19237_5544 [Photobacterium aphoticum]|uniref:Uncharacterized protein n=2 Tax=Gammaproteobacteria TaxID=1236 RepID=A0A090QI92_9GAMM|nr:hypothetical protein JCM19237_5544 [Photobacterium aphoticum]